MTWSTASCSLLKHIALRISIDNGSAAARTLARIDIARAASSGSAEILAVKTAVYRPSRPLKEDRTNSRCFLWLDPALPPTR